MPNFTESEIEIRDLYIRLDRTSGQYVTSFMHAGSVGDKLVNRDYFEAFCKITEIYYTLKTLNALEENEKSQLEELKEMLKVEAKGE
jgi:hypothetical protein